MGVGTRGNPDPICGRIKWMTRRVPAHIGFDNFGCVWLQFREAPRLLEIPVELLVSWNLQLLIVDTRVGLLSRSLYKEGIRQICWFQNDMLHVESTGQCSGLLAGRE